MTLILGLNAKRHTFLVSDRRLTYGENKKEFDQNANKTVVFMGRDYLVAVGYTGMAYRKGLTGRPIPTDEWLVEKLLGQPQTSTPAVSEHGIKAVDFPAVGTLIHRLQLTVKDLRADDRVLGLDTTAVNGPRQM